MRVSGDRIQDTNSHGHGHMAAEGTGDYVCVKTIHGVAKVVETCLEKRGIVDVPQRRRLLLLRARPESRGRGRNTLIYLLRTGAGIVQSIPVCDRECRGLRKELYRGGTSVHAGVNPRQNSTIRGIVLECKRSTSTDQATLSA